MQLRKWAVLGLGAAMAAAAPAQAQTPSARQLVDRYVEAIGGRERIEAVVSRHMVYEMTANGVTTAMEVWQTRPNLLKMTSSTPTGEVEVAYGTDGETVWYSFGSMGARVLEREQGEEVRMRGTFDADLLLDDDVFTTMETVGRAEHGDHACWNVRMVTHSGIELTRCFDVESGLTIAVTHRQGGNEITTTIDEYREFDGIRYPARTTASAMGQTVVTTLLSVDHSPIPASEFAVPEGVRP